MIRSAALVVALVLSCAGSLGCAGSAMAQSAEDQAACQDDAFRFCQATIPDRERTLACLVYYKDSISPACCTVLASVIPPDPPARKKKSAPRSRQSSGPIDLSPR